MLEVTPIKVHCGKCARRQTLCSVHQAKISDMRDEFVALIRRNYESKLLAAYGHFIDKTMLPEDDRIEPLDDNAYRLMTAASILYYRKSEGSV